MKTYESTTRNQSGIKQTIEKRNRQEMNTRIKTDERIRRLVVVLENDTLPRRQLIADLELRQDSRRNFYSNYLHPAIAKGYVCMMRPDSPSSPEQAYRLTTKGLDFLEQLKQEENSKNEQPE